MSVASSTIAIRLAGVVDAEAMAAIHRACFAKNWSAGEIAQFVAAPGCLSLLASLSPRTNGARVPYRQKRRRRG